MSNAPFVKKIAEADALAKLFYSRGKWEFAICSNQKGLTLQQAQERNRRHRSTTNNDKLRTMESTQKKRHAKLMSRIHLQLWTSGRSIHSRYKLKNMGRSWFQYKPSMTVEQKKQQTLRYDCMEAANEAMWKDTLLCEDVMGEILGYM